MPIHLLLFSQASCCGSCALLFVQLLLVLPPSGCKQYTFGPVCLLLVSLPGCCISRAPSCVCSQPCMRQIAWCFFHSLAAATHAPFSCLLAAVFPTWLLRIIRTRICLWTSNRQTACCCCCWIWSSCCDPCAPSPVCLLLFLLSRCCNLCAVLIVCSQVNMRQTWLRWIGKWWRDRLSM